MKSIVSLLFINCFFLSITAQVKNTYAISFKKAVHHEAVVEAKFTNIQLGKASLLFSKTAPGSFGVYQFAKNIYDLSVTNSSGKALDVTTVGLNQWDVEGHDGVINVSYKVFADQGDTVFSKFSEEGCVINAPATFIYMPALESRPIEVTYNKNANWSIATHLKQTANNVYEAENLQEFMESPALLAPLITRAETLTSGTNNFKLQLATSFTANDAVVDSIFQGLLKVAETHKTVFGGYPIYENDTYQFLISTIPVTQQKSVAGYRNTALATYTDVLTAADVPSIVRELSKAYFQSWNTTRMRPAALTPFNLQAYAKAKEYWFTEGFANYYAYLNLRRAGVISQDRFLEELSHIISDVVSCPALVYTNANAISEKALFYKGLSQYADSQNTPNIYMAPEQHGLMIALVLDLQLRQKNDLSLDDYMKLVWTKYGKTEIPFRVENLYTTLREYAGDTFADNFFKYTIDKPRAFDYKRLLASVGVVASAVKAPYLGAKVAFNAKDMAEIVEYTKRYTPAYNAGLEKGDIIVSINSRAFSNLTEYENVISKNKVGKRVAVKYKRNGVDKTTYAKFKANPNVVLSDMAKLGSKTNARKRAWLEHTEAE
jgi:predicted metalloprotease with PDZ domain